MPSQSNLSMLPTLFLFLTTAPIFLCIFPPLKEDKTKKEDAVRETWLIVEDFQKMQSHKDRTEYDDGLFLQFLNTKDESMYEARHERLKYKVEDAKNMVEMLEQYLAYRSKTNKNEPEQHECIVLLRALVEYEKVYLQDFKEKANDAMLGKPTTSWIGGAIQNNKQRSRAEPFSIFETEMHQEQVDEVAHKSAQGWIEQKDPFSDRDKNLGFAASISIIPSSVMAGSTKIIDRHNTRQKPSILLKSETRGASKTEEPEIEETLQQHMDSLAKGFKNWRALAKSDEQEDPENKDENVEVDDESILPMPTPQHLAEVRSRSQPIFIIDGTPNAQVWPRPQWVGSAEISEEGGQQSVTNAPRDA